MESISTANDVLVDNYGRRINYLRVSLTERCNLRCGYCYGSDGNSRIKGRSLSDSEFIQIIKAFSISGINKVRFTGGEPLLRQGIVEIIRETSAIRGISSVCLTTNGILLDLFLRPLIEAGLNRLNVSLDTLNARTFRAITGNDGFRGVYEAINEAIASSAFGRVKINTVVMRGVNDSEIPEFARWALSENIELRFIEFMPTRRSAWGESLFVGEDEIRSKIGLDLEREVADRDNSGPAVTYRFGDLPGRIGFISAVSRSFCDGCNRLRLTSRGDLIGCLFGSRDVNLKNLLADGASPGEIAEFLSLKIKTPGFRRLPGPGGISIGEKRPFMRGVGG